MLMDKSRAEAIVLYYVTLKDALHKSQVVKKPDPETLALELEKKLVIDEKKVPVAKSIVPIPPVSLTGLAYDARMEGHKPTDSHCECPERMVAIYERLNEKGLVKRCQLVPGREATEEEILRAHSEQLFKTLMEYDYELQRNPHTLYHGGDTYLCESSLIAARVAAGIAVDMVEKVWLGQLKNGFAVLRPPGHHATSNKIMGFCLLNNVAIAARHAQKLGASRILIFDWDVHHGNGTQDVFYEDPGVLYISLHRYGMFFPGTGAHTEVGKGEGVGKTVNMAWPRPRLGDSEYILATEKLLLPIAQEFDPQLVLISAGYDIAPGDPLGGMRVSALCCARMVRLLSTLADGKVMAVLEGGYDCTNLADGVEACVREMLGEAQGDPDCEEEPQKIGLIAIQRLYNAQKEHWHCVQDIPIFYEGDLELTPDNSECFVA